MSGFDVHALVGELSAAGEAAARVVRAAPLGIRTVEPAVGIRRYLAAFDGPRFLCLDRDLRPLRTERDVRECAAAVLLWERGRDEVDVAALHALAGSIGRLIAGGGVASSIDQSLQWLAAGVLRLAAWAAAPEREIAAVADLDEAISRHVEARERYAAFVRATDPLVERQSELPAELIDGLRRIEEGVGSAGLGTPLAGRLGEWMDDCDAGAGEIVAAHVTALIATS